MKGRIKAGLLSSCAQAGVISVSCGMVPPNKDGLVSNWRSKRARYESVVVECLKSKSATFTLAQKDKDLAIDGLAHFVQERRIVVFVLARWDLDNSYGIVYQEGSAVLPESEPVLEKWVSPAKLADHWYFVQGT